VPIDGAVRAVEQGIKVERNFFSVRDGSKVTRGALKAGEAYYAILTITTDQPYDNLIISDLLPAGLEIESTEQAFLIENKMARLNVIHSEKRDDRIIVFAGTEAGKAPASYCYAVRAITPGSYVLPPLEAECMYNSDIFFVGSESVLEIRK
jgi:alpha-2-macroglobulin